VYGEEILREEILRKTALGLTVCQFASLVIIFSRLSLKETPYYPTL
jgi:hypothetical protein